MLMDAIINVIIIPILQVEKMRLTWAPRPASECMGQGWVWQE